MPDLNAIAIERTMEEYGFPSNPQFIERVRRYIGLILKWNEAISLTTVTDFDAILRFHFGESLFAVSTVPIENGRLADVGSGAGFPGLALAMARPLLKVTLIESNAKKSAFLHEVIRDLSLKNARAVRSRMKDTAVEEHFDFTTARALGQFDSFLTWSRDRLDSSGKAVLWLGGADVVSIRSKRGWGWSPEVPIPRSEQRFLLFGSPEPE